MSLRRPYWFPEKGSHTSVKYLSRKEGTLFCNLPKLIILYADEGTTFWHFRNFQAQLRALTLSKALKSTKSLKDVPYSINKAFEGRVVTPIPKLRVYLFIYAILLCPKECVCVCPVLGVPSCQETPSSGTWPVSNTDINIRSKGPNTDLCIRHGVQTSVYICVCVCKRQI
jgi:hypothetical protein